MSKLLNALKFRFRRSTEILSARSAFTLSEVVISLAILGAMSSGVYVGFNSINTYAVTSRLYSEALTAAQNQIDLTLSKAPFDVTAAYVSGSFNPALGKVPAELMTTAELDALAASGVTFPTAAPTPPATSSSYYPYYPYYRTATGQPLKKQAFIYRDPVTGNAIVTGVLTVTVTDPGLTMTYINSLNNNQPWPLNVRKTNATVTYTFRNRDYAVSLDSMRTADQ
jgi:prepilin-type N-terminal cleavage/methylation domain-containing protein